MLVATPRDYFASCHEMKEDKRTRVQGDLFQSILEAFPYFGSEVRNGAPVTALGRLTLVTRNPIISHNSFPFTSSAWALLTP